MNDIDNHLSHAPIETRTNDLLPAQSPLSCHPASGIHPPVMAASILLPRAFSAHGASAPPDSPARAPKWH